VASLLVALGMSVTEGSLGCIRCIAMVVGILLLIVIKHGSVVGMQRYITLSSSQSWPIRSFSRIATLQSLLAAYYGGSLAHAHGQALSHSRDALPTTILSLAKGIVWSARRQASLLALRLVSVGTFQEVRTWVVMANDTTSYEQARVHIRD